MLMCEQTQAKSLPIAVVMYLTLTVHLSYATSHQHGHSTYHMHQRRAVYSDESFCGLKVSRDAEIHRRLSAQYGDSVLPKQSVHEWTDMFKSGQTSITDKERSECPAHQQMKGTQNKSTH
jgi:hypothetical protein